MIEKGTKHVHVYDKQMRVKSNQNLSRAIVT